MKSMRLLRLAVACLLGTMIQNAEAVPLCDLLRKWRADRPPEKAGPATPTTQLASGAKIAAPGRYEIHLQHDGLQRMYLVHVPRNWQPEATSPLVMALHGGGGGMIYQASDALYGLITKSEQAGFIAVFPNGVSNTKSGMLATWNAGNCCAKARDDKVDDVGFLRKVVADVAMRVGIDRRRVFAIGMSNGAMMSYRLACEASDVFHGIMAVAGTDNTTQCAPRFPVPVLHIHARNDDRVLFDGGAGQKFRREELVTDFVAVPDSIAKWVRLDHAADTPRRVLSVPGATCDLHEAAAGGAPVKLCVTETGGHSWPGGSKDRGDEPPSQAIRANDLMWEFFSAL
jgi:polyhydroxybutyrate depolymerase